MLKSIHYCPPTSKFHSRSYHDATLVAPSSALTGSTTVIPQDDGEGHALLMEYGLSTFRDHQTIHIQEMPERAPAGQLPRGVEVVLADDLVDCCKPGDRIQMVGVYKSSGGGQGARGFSFVPLVKATRVFSDGSAAPSSSLITSSSYPPNKEVASRKHPSPILISET